MPRKKQSEKEETLADWAKKGLEIIVKLSKSQLISDKLQAYNILLFVVIATVNLTYFLGGSLMSGFSLAIISAFCFGISLACVIVYGPLVSIVANLSGNKIAPLRLGITTLFISLTFGFAGLTFNTDLLGKISLGLMGLQLLLIPLGSLFVSETSIADKETKPLQIWDTLGKISSVTGIVGFIIDLVLILIRA
jgi:hypothetical protein